MGSGRRSRAAGQAEDGRRLAAVLSASLDAAPVGRRRRRSAPSLGVAAELAHELGAAVAERLADALRPALAALREEVAALRHEVAALRHEVAGLRARGRASGRRGGPGGAPR